MQLNKQNRFYVLFVLLNLFYITNTTTAQTNTKQIKAKEDTYVFSNGGNDNAKIRQFDNAGQLKSYTHQTLDTWSYKTYLKFDLSVISNNPEQLKNATLKLIGKEDQGSFAHTISLYTLSSNEWAEDELSYNNRSTTGSANKIASISLTVGKSDIPFSFDLTNILKQFKLEGKHTISFMLADDINVRNPANGQGSIITLYSKDASGENYPRIEFEETDVSDLLLSDIHVGGVSMDDFHPEKYVYEVDVNPAQTTIPVVEVFHADASVIIDITNAASLKGGMEERTTTIKVSKDTRFVEYKIIFGNFISPADASLKKLEVDGREIEFFNENTLKYHYYCPYLQSSVPAVSYKAKSLGQEIIFEGIKDIYSSNESDRSSTITVSSIDKTQTKKYEVVFTILPKLDLYLCIGQSNMAGRGYMDESKGDLIPLENSYLFTPEFNFEKASNPMNKYSNIRRELSMQQISPSWGFAKYLNDRLSDVTTGMIVNAQGGSAMEDWQKGKSLYDSTVSRAKEAVKWGDFKGILWHQGESNVSAEKIAAYPNQLKAMVNNLRIDLAAPNACFIAGELIYSYGGSTNFNKMIQTIASFLENSDYVSAKDLQPRAAGDVHFDRGSNILLGERYAEKVINKIYPYLSSVNYVNNQSKEVVYADKKQIYIQGFNEGSEFSIYDISGNKLRCFGLKEYQKNKILIENPGIYIVLVRNRNIITSHKLLIP